MYPFFSACSIRSRTRVDAARQHAGRGTVRAQSGRALIIALVALAALLAGLIIARGLLEQSVELQAASIYPEARTLAPFELEDATGSAFTEKDLQGRLSLLFFGFTNCPDICPDTLGVLARAMEKLETMRVDSMPQVVFVSVDPDRDAGKTMQDYVNYFDDRFEAVTGNDDALAALTGQVGAMFIRRSPDESGYYAVDHSGMIVIVDSRGRMIGRFPPASDADAIAADLFALIRAQG
ncbi:MAG TPA: SCO family protein [Wenzhouxiangellaceae bacterium]|nr:SCO family protein [Wenzhouxiangellaceae bacterium]